MTGAQNNNEAVAFLNRIVNVMEGILETQEQALCVLEEIDGRIARIGKELGVRDED